MLRETTKISEELEKLNIILNKKIKNPITWKANI